MREHPWHLRRVSAEHQYRYRNLLDLHAITRGWLAELGVDRPAHLLPRGVQLSPDVASTLWMLENIPSGGPENGLERLLDDTYPDDVLGRLEHAVWAVQAWTLSSILSKTDKSDRRATMNQLEQSSFKAGRLCCASRWQRAIETSGEGKKKNGMRDDLRIILSAYRSSPFYGAGSQLVRRATRTEIQLELIQCPHNARFPETQSVADELCELHAHWTRGYVYEVQTRVVIERQPRDEKAGRTRCLQRWTFSGNA